MLYVEVCATSANIGIGFDVLGLALNLKNRFTFEKKETFSFQGFQHPFDEKEHNLVYQAYVKVFQIAKQEPIPVEITFKGQVPIARGLGSSATLIVAGMLAANQFLGNPFHKEDLLQIGTALEGHPDNIAPALYGGFVASYRDQLYHSIPYPVSSLLKFFVVIPSYEVSTEQARAILPKAITYPEVIANLSRIIHLPKALSEGNLALLRSLLQDQLHEPYRKTLIPEYDLVKHICDQEGLAFAISGSGSTMLVIGTEESVIDQLKIKNCKTMLLDVGTAARIWEE